MVRALAMSSSGIGVRLPSGWVSTTTPSTSCTRNNPLEDLTVRLPMICDRYELRHAALPRPGAERGRP